MLLAGALYDRVGAAGYLAMSVAGAVGLALMLAHARTRPVGVSTPVADERRA
jgi:hypothetical protein